MLVIEGVEVVGIAAVASAEMAALFETPAEIIGDGLIGFEAGGSAGAAMDAPVELGDGDEDGRQLAVAN